MGRIIFLICVIALSFETVHSGNLNLRMEFMPLDQAQKKWGKTSFNAKKFKSGGESERASMVVDLIKSKKFIGKSLAEVRGQLGEPDGYFQNDAIPTYFLSSPSKDKKTDVWQLVFSPDKDFKNVKEVKIHKNCCY